MENHAKVLDCTLRDGAYLIDKKFGNDTINGIISGLVKAKIDFIEIGFFQNEGFGDGKTVFKNSADAKKFIPEDKQGCKFTVLADFSRYSIENLDECTGDSIDAIRECFFKKERFEALEVCKKIKEKGYKLFVQPVDILGYTDKELIEFIELINEIEPYCLSIVDTFGSMYQEDLHRVFELINHNLIPPCKIGFHSHNNMQLSNALSQEFLRMTVGKRQVVVDGTINGMGRGAGNTPTELVVQYMNSNMGYSYDLDAILDIIDCYMDNIKSRCTWGYTIPYFIAGCYSAHVNNISYLLKKNSIKSKDIRFILNHLDANIRKRYDYELLEQRYLDLLNSDIDDTNAIEQLKENLVGKKVLVVAPGSSVTTMKAQIGDFIEKNDVTVISVNFLNDEINSDYVFVSNLRRLQNLEKKDKFLKTSKIITSNISIGMAENDCMVSILKLIKCGWEHLDNSTLMLLRLLDYIGVAEIDIAGFDGYEYSGRGHLNYATEEWELSSVNENPSLLNEEIIEMLDDFKQSKKCDVHFITSSRFEKCFK